MEQVANPHLPWLLEYGGTTLFVVVLALVVRQVARERTFTPTALMVIGGWSIWWQEWWLDWAYYLIWSPEFDVTFTEDWTGWSTPVKPWLLVMSGYGYYWAWVFTSMTWFAAKMRERKPEWPRWKAFLVIAIPVAYAINLLFEGFTTQMGWWSYTEAAWPVIDFGEGKFSLTFPILFMTLFPVVAGLILDMRDDRGNFAYEARLGLTNATARAGAWLEAKRALAIIALMNVLYFALSIGPGIIMRYAFGPDSTLVP